MAWCTIVHVEGVMFCEGVNVCPIVHSLIVCPIVHFLIVYPVAWSVALVADGEGSTRLFFNKSIYSREHFKT